MSYSWKILTLHTNDEENSDGDTLSKAVIRVRWLKFLTDELGNKSKYLGYTNLDPSSTSSADFISFEDLTEETVISWIEAAHSPDFTAGVNRALERNLKKIVIEKPDLPW